MRIRYVLLAAGVLAIGACKDPNRPNLNNPGVDDFSKITDVSQIQSLTTGVLASDRGQHTAEITRSEIVGRDAYIITGSEPRWNTELLGETIDASDFLGASVFPYATIRLTNIGIAAVKATDATVLSDQQKAVTIGFLQTFKAIEYMRVMETHDTVGAPINVDTPPTDPPAPLSCKSDVLHYIVALLDSAATNLSAGGEFPFSLPAGFSGFDQPSTFLTFNRGLAAKANLYLAFRNGPGSPDAAALAAADAALAASFLSTDPADLDVGPMHNFSSNSGDATNGLYGPPASTTIRVNPRVLREAEAGDRRLQKIDSANALSASDVSSKYVFVNYTSPTSPVPILTNKELLLLAAEAKWGEGKMDSALVYANIVRVNDGGLTADANNAPDAVLNRILYEKRYSLLYESADRWPDLRMFGKLNGSEPPAGVGQERGLPPLNNLPLPQSEVNARGGVLDKQCTTT
ncbi:MAG: hypothetical protein IRY91_03795 [Gemmatimonadaceae bacterium]|nr:hypothetical protein [Gemmatimonadaceae bacterium]